MNVNNGVGSSVNNSNGGSNNVKSNITPQTSVMNATTTSGGGNQWEWLTMSL